MLSLSAMMRSTSFYIGTPIDTHAELARRALLSGKNVLVEEAFATTAADARSLAPWRKSRAAS
jgi:predicted dehydrogenase